MITLAELSSLGSKAAVEEFLAARFPNDNAAAVNALDAGLNSVLRTDLKQARQYVERAGRVFACLPDSYQPRLLGMEARVFHYSGQHKKALPKYLDALSLYRKQRESVNVARLNRVLAEVYMYLGKYTDALGAGRKAVRYFETHDMMSDAAQTMVNVGNVYHRMDNNRMALRYYDRARAVFAESGGVPLAIVDYNRANILTNLFRLDEAKALYKSAGAIYGESQLTIPETICNYSIAYLYFLDGRYTDALTLFEQVLDRFEQVGDRRSAAVTKLDLAELNLQLNQFGSAVSLADEVVGLFRSLGMVYEEGKAHFFAAVGQLSLGDVVEAGRSLRRAEKIFEAEGNDLWLGMVHSARGRLLMARGRFADAARESQSARKLFSRSKDERRAVDADIARLAANLRSGRHSRPPQAAKRLLDMSLTQFQEYSVREMLGRFHYERGDFAEALYHLKPAVEAVEKMAARLHYDDIRHFFVIDKLGTYNRMVHSLLALNETDDAFVRNLGALSLINRPSISEKRLRDEVPPELTARIEQLRLSLQQYQRFPRAGQRLGSTMTQVRRDEQQLWALEQKARASVVDVLRERGAVRRSEPDLRKSLLPGETVVNFVEWDGSVGAFLVDSRGVEFVGLTIDGDKLRADIRKLHFLFESAVRSREVGASRSTDAVDDLLEEFYKRLIVPLEGMIRSDRLIILADGLFAEIPFGAIGRADSPLSSRYDLRMIVDPGQIWSREAEPVDWECRRHAIFSVPSPTLPSVDFESREIASLFVSAELFSGEAATCAALRRELVETDGVVHIATHASRSSENPLFSRMLMSDGPFFPFDLFGTGITAKLTTLSGCQTAAPGLNYGNSFSLAKAFYQAGSRYVLASLWPVADSLTRTFMVEFYGLLRRGETVPRAYIAAVEKLRALAPAAAYWGSFVLLGL